MHALYGLNALQPFLAKKTIKRNKTGFTVSNGNGLIGFENYLPGGY